jgi:hypothetical protein
MTAYKDIEKRKVYQKLWAREKAKKNAIISEQITVETIVETQIVETILETQIVESPIVETEEIVETILETQIVESPIVKTEEIVETAEEIVEMIATPVVEIANKIEFIPHKKIYDGYSLLYLENERQGLSQTPPALIWKKRGQSVLKRGWNETAVNKPEQKIIRQSINGVLTGKCFI